MLKRTNGGSAAPLTGISPIAIAGRQTWNERYGDYVASARTYKWIAFGCMALAAVAVGGLAWDRSQQKVLPFVVQTDRLGDRIVVGPAEPANSLDPVMIRAILQRWVRNTRTVSFDALVQRQLVAESYALIRNNSAAQQRLADFYRENPPFVRAQDESVAITPRAALRVSDNTWEVQWTEEKRSRSGARIGPITEWRASVTFSVIPPRDVDTIQTNPFGLYIESFHWSSN